MFIWRILACFTFQDPFVFLSMFLYASPNINGKIRSEKSMAHNIPPITTLASGRELSEPIPVEMAAGNNPIAAMSAVIMTGLILNCTPCFIAS